MICKSCNSGNQKQFAAEINLHFRDFNDRDKPALLVFPEVSVCLDCGTSQFKIPDKELEELKGDIAA